MKADEPEGGVILFFKNRALFLRVDFTFSKKFKSFLLLAAMEVDDMYTEEEKMELEDNTVSHILNNSTIFSVFSDTIATLFSSVHF